MLFNPPPFMTTLQANELTPRGIEEVLEVSVDGNHVCLYWQPHLSTLIGRQTLQNHAEFIQSWASVVYMCLHPSGS